MKKEFTLKNLEIKSADGAVAIEEVTVAVELTVEEAVVMWKEGGTALKAIAMVAEKIVTTINAAKSKSAEAPKK